MKRRLFILVPSLSPTGPIKGAIALANALAGQRDVTLVALKTGPGADARLDELVNVIVLEAEKWRDGIRSYRHLLVEAGKRSDVASISFCLSADLTNAFCGRQAVTCASVRGNLVRNYRYDYGLVGYPIAAMHLFMLRRIDHVVAMTDSMARQVARFTGSVPEIIPNFVDEAPLDPFRRRETDNHVLRFVFLGSLTKRKQPQLVVEAIGRLRSEGNLVHLHLIGAGSLMDDLQRQAAVDGLMECVTFHGQMANPYELLSTADALVLPSLSEGLPRAGLEALHLGIPCVLRAADGNAELITSGENGVLFEHDSDLASAMVEAANISRSRSPEPGSLLPERFRQSAAAARYLTLIERNY